LRCSTPRLRSVVLVRPHDAVVRQEEAQPEIWMGHTDTQMPPTAIRSRPPKLSTCWTSPGQHPVYRQHRTTSAFSGLPTAHLERLTAQSVQSRLGIRQRICKLSARRHNVHARVSWKYPRRCRSAHALRVLAEHEGFLNKFEIGQIIILQPADLDQAFALIPR